MERMSKAKDKFEGKYGNCSGKVVKHGRRMADVLKVSRLCD